MPGSRRLKVLELAQSNSSRANHYVQILIPFLNFHPLKKSQRCASESFGPYFIEPALAYPCSLAFLKETPGVNKTHYSYKFGAMQAGYRRQCFVFFQSLMK